MSDFSKNDAYEEKVGVAMNEYHQYIKDLTGLDARAGQIGPIEIYKVARKAAEDVLKEKEATPKIIT